MKILIPTDFSDISFKALKYAAEMSLKLKAELVILHTVTTLNNPFINEDERLDENRSKVEDTNKQFQRVNKFLGDISPDIKANIVLKEGPPVENTIETCNEEGADMVVMATQGSEGLKELLFGSNTGKVLSEINVPLIVVPKEAEFKGINKITFATKLNPEDIGFFKSVANLAGTFNASIEVLHISSSKLSGAKENMAKEFFSKLQEIYPNISLKTLVSENLAKSIEKHVRETESNLLVLIKRKSNIFKKLFGESISMDMTLHSHNPLLIYPKQD